MAAQTRWRGRYAEKSEEMDPVRPVRTSVVPRSVTPVVIRMARRDSYGVSMSAYCSR